MLPKAGLLDAEAEPPKPVWPNPVADGVVFGRLFAALRPKDAGCPEKAEKPPAPPDVVVAVGLANAANPPPVEVPNAPVAGLRTD